MSASTAREALIVEAIGDVVGLLDRLEALAPILDGSRQAAVEASAELSGALEALEGRMAAVSDTAGCSSTSLPPPITPPAVQPITTFASISRRSDGHRSTAVER